MLRPLPYRRIARLSLLCSVLFAACSPVPPASVHFPTDPSAPASTTSDSSKASASSTAPEKGSILTASHTIRPASAAGQASPAGNGPATAQAEPATPRAEPGMLRPATALTASPQDKTLQPSDNGLPRANPSYIQWLERQSLLRNTPELAAVVSGSSLPWKAPAAVNDIASLLKQASVWLDFNPYQAAFDGKSSVLAALTKQQAPAQLARLGIRGILLAPAGESGLAWSAENDFSEQGRDVASFALAQAVGSEADYAALEHQADGLVLLGGDILPGGTGLGPDFFLASRGVRDYPGLYMMVEMPDNVWKQLPISLLNSGSVGRPISKELVAQLAGQHVLPPALSRDADPLATIGGWAVTPEIVGVDGVNRRWVYRCVGTPLRPVLNWDDPSGAAKRVLSASVIRQVGLLHQPLVGLRMEALWGQDPGSAAGSGEPALSAMRALGREVRRYGAWSMLRDPFPAARLPLLQGIGVDFVPDTVTSPALEYALLTGDAAPLRQAVDESLRLGVDHSRLWREAADGTGVRFDLAGLSLKTALAKRPNAASWLPVLPVDRDTLYATAAALASLANGYSTEDTRRWVKSAGTSADAAKKVQLIQRAHLLQVAFRALQPGLFMLSGHDLAGSLFVPQGTPLPGGMAWNLDGSMPLATKQGLPVAGSTYMFSLNLLDAQLKEPDSFAAELRQILTIRDQSGVALGRLNARPVTSDSATVALITTLPRGGFLLVTGNFSPNALTTELTLPRGLIKGNGTDMVSGNSVAMAQDKLRLSMPPWGYRAVHFDGGAPVSPAPLEAVAPPPPSILSEVSTPEASPSQAVPQTVPQAAKPVSVKPASVKPATAKPASVEATPARPASHEARPSQGAMIQ